MNLSCTLFVAGLLSWVSATWAQSPDDGRTLQHDYRIAFLESKVSALERRPSVNYGVQAGGAAMLFAAFCALWAQNTGRSAWLWFFVGLLLTVFAALAVLVKNSNDRARRREAER